MHLLNKKFKASTDKIVKRFVLIFIKQSVYHVGMDAIEYLGGTSATARFFKVTPQVVNNWRCRHGGLPKNWQIVAIEMGVPAHIVRPDLFSRPVESLPAADCKEQSGERAGVAMGGGVGV
jgi:hypothetical protein